MGVPGRPSATIREQDLVGDDRQEERVVQRRGRPELAVGAVAAGAIAAVQGREVGDLVRRNRPLVGLRACPAFRQPAASEASRMQGWSGTLNASVGSRSAPRPIRRRTLPSGSGPWPAGGMWTISERTTTIAAGDRRTRTARR